VPSASSIRHKPSSWDCASIGNVKQRHRKDTYDKASKMLASALVSAIPLLTTVCTKMWGRLRFWQGRK
jgi:hypothetical protein